MALLRMPIIQCVTLYFIAKLVAVEASLFNECKADNMHVKLIIIHIRLHPFETMLPVATRKEENKSLELMTLPYMDDDYRDFAGRCVGDPEYDSVSTGRLLQEVCY